MGSLTGIVLTSGQIESFPISEKLGATPFAPSDLLGQVDFSTELSIFKQPYVHDLALNFDSAKWNSSIKAYSEIEPAAITPTKGFIENHPWWAALGLVSVALACYVKGMFSGANRVASMVNSRHPRETTKPEDVWKN